MLPKFVKKKVDNFKCLLRTRKEPKYLENYIMCYYFLNK